MGGRRRAGPVHNASGDTYWSDGRHLHREGGPAVVRADGTREWWVHGRLHRTDGPAVVTAAGDRLFFLHGRAHRDGGPARAMANGDLEWFRHGYRHRLDGPAVIHVCGRTEHWVDGRMAHTVAGWAALRSWFAGEAALHATCDPAHPCAGVAAPAPMATPPSAPWVGGFGVLGDRGAA